ncbi:hypothetical protein EJ03DRAFT_378608 [Teratosphaeria nubilosa]|uniref:Cytochrome b5 heme-binding domain-containing protein n=1 Tax=Teratosphaeria nubilosa TaxID=161662 RepID=A0A6G1KVU4_9PEZI|nr:hypothetical protein EJ03DRAFT_378608 [Teratosphaeria nubilosa]
MPRLITYSTLGLLALGAAAKDGLRLTEKEMEQYDGTDDSKPIYLAINGTIFDVSASPSFYGPGGHYHHFTGKDASRAWVSQCWDTEDQLTWRMEGIEEIFMPKYLDEQMAAAADGEADSAIEGAAAFGNKELARMARPIIEKIGRPSKKEIEKRRKSDKKEALEGAKKSLKHWIDFFQNNEKYAVVGEVVLDKENKPEPPKVCEAALNKRPMKGGRLQKMLDSTGGLGMYGGDANKNAREGKMPNFVQDMLKDKKEEKANEEGKDEL